MTNRELNRATLARQLLLRRESLTALAAVTRLVALQAQDALSLFLALWARLREFSRADLGALLEQRLLVRATLMRATLHLVSAAQFMRVRAAVAPGIARAMPKRLAAQIEAFGRERVLTVARDQLTGTPVPFRVLREQLAGHFPDLDERALVHAVRTHLRLVHVAGGSQWSFTAGAPVTPAASWLAAADSGVAYAEALEHLILAYLGSFGPASVRDAQEWTGLRGIAAVFDRLRPRLLAITAAADQRELFDLEDAPRPSADVVAPARLLPAYTTTWSWPMPIGVG